jgi:flagellar assembly factor FliW
MLSDRFGCLQVDDACVLTAPRGITGFSTLRRLALLDGPRAPRGAAPEMYWLQAADEPSLALLCLVPWPTFGDYDLRVDRVLLGIEHDDDVSVLNLVTVRRDRGAGAAIRMTANLRAPLVVDTRRRLLHQVILTDSRWRVDVPIPVAGGASPATEVA